MTAPPEPLDLDEIRTLAKQIIKGYLDTCMPPGIPEPPAELLPEGEVSPYGAIANGHANCAFILASMAMIAATAFDGKAQALKRLESMKRGIERLNDVKP